MLEMMRCVLKIRTPLELKKMSQIRIRYYLSSLVHGLHGELIKLDDHFL